MIEEEKLQRVKKLFLKCKLLGCVREFPTYCGHRYYVMDIGDHDKIIYIPDDVTEINSRMLSFKYNKLANVLWDIHANIKVAGGSGLIHTLFMFANCKANKLDLSLLDTHNVKSMRGMFNCVSAEEIDLSNMDTSNTKKMISMFGYCSTYKLDLSSFDTSNVSSMNSMFQKSSIRELNVTSFNTRNVTDMNAMFHSCKNLKSLDLSSFDLRIAIDTRFMFDGCKAKIIAKDDRLLKLIDARYE